MSLPVLARESELPLLSIEPGLPGEVPPDEPDFIELSDELLLFALLWCFARPITSIFSARLEAGSKLARTCVPSRIAEMPAATGCPRRSTCVWESTVSVMPPADWSRVMLFWSTFSTEPVTVRRLPWSEEEPEDEALMPPALEPLCGELVSEELLVPPWPYVEPEEPLCPIEPDEEDPGVLPCP